MTPAKLPEDRKDLPLHVSVTAALFGALLHAQYSFFSTAGYKGLTLNIADLLLPFAGLFILAMLLLRRASWPQWRIRGGYIWLASMTAVLTLALVNGYRIHHEWSHWALVNKYIGWFILMAYFGIGGWLVANYGRAAAIKAIGGFVAIGTLIALQQAGHALFLDLTTGVGVQTDDYISGLVGNRNAYAFLLLVTFIGAVLSLIHGNLFTNRYISGVFILITPAVLLYDGSRAAFIALILMVIIFSCLYPRIMTRRIFPILLAGVALFAIVNATPHANGYNRLVKHQIERAIKNVTSDKPRKRITSEQQRLRFFDDSLTLWKEHPVIGIGLGSYWKFALEKYGEKQADIIDCTPLWLLTETGIVGVTLFGALFLYALYTLWRDSKGQDDPDAAIRRAVIFIMLSFMVMALFHELLYQRALWLFMGMGLAVPAVRNTRQN